MAEPKGLITDWAVAIPQSLEHARMMVLVGQRYINEYVDTTKVRLGVEDKIDDW